MHLSVVFKVRVRVRQSISCFSSILFNIADRNNKFETFEFFSGISVIIGSLYYKAHLRDSTDHSRFYLDKRHAFVEPASKCVEYLLTIAAIVREHKRVWIYAGLALKTMNVHHILYSLTCARGTRYNEVVLQSGRGLEIVFFGR